MCIRDSEAYNVNSGTKGYGGASDAVAGKTAKRTKITSIVSTNEKTLTIKWNKITGAYGYRIKRSTDEDGTYKVVKTIKSGNTTSYKDTSVKAGKTYYYTVETMVKTGDNICYSCLLYTSCKYRKERKNLLRKHKQFLRQRLL